MSTTFLLIAKVVNLNDCFIQVKKTNSRKCSYPIVCLDCNVKRSDNNCRLMKCYSDCEKTSMSTVVNLRAKTLKHFLVVKIFVISQIM